MNTRAVLLACLISSIPYSTGRAEPSAPVFPTVVKAEPAGDWNDRFDGKEGWIGGDCAYSTELSSNRILWLFGDTLLGSAKNGNREGARMVSNTVGIQVGTGKETAIRFASKKGKDGKAEAFFVPKDGKGWFWVQAAIRVENRLFLFLPQVDKSSDPGVLGFKHVGQWLAAIDNPDDEPEKWQTKQIQLPFVDFGAERERSWGSAILKDGEYLYVYGYDQKRGKNGGPRKLIVARVPAKKLDDVTAWRFRTSDGWSEKAADSIPLAEGFATEFSVNRAPNGKGFMAVYTENGLSSRILGRSANAPDGPWSPAVLLYDSPEMAKDKGVFSYAAKAHPWAANGNELVISYCTNTWDFGRLFRDDKVYRPKFVRVQLAVKAMP